VKGGALTVDQSGLLDLVLAVISVVSSIVVVSCIVSGGCIIGISCVVGIVICKVVSRTKPERMLAFSASKLMHCGGGGMGILLSVVLVFSGIVVGGCIVFISCVVIIGSVVSIIWMVSHIKPAWMLAFSASKSMHCGGGGMGSWGGGVAWVGSGVRGIVVCLVVNVWSLYVVAWFVFVFFMLLIVIVGVEERGAASLWSWAISAQRCSHGWCSGRGSWSLLQQPLDCATEFTS